MCQGELSEDRRMREKSAEGREEGKKPSGQTEPYLSMPVVQRKGKDVHDSWKAPGFPPPRIFWLLAQLN